MGCCSSKLILTKETKSINKETQNITEEIEKKENNENQNEYRNKINLIYSTKSKDEYIIIGRLFFMNNKDNIEIILNGEQKASNFYLVLEEGENRITIVIKNKLVDLRCMFCACETLKDITELKYLDVSEIKDFESMFSGCCLLSDINALENWNVSNGENFSYMFSKCSSLSDISALRNWNIHNCKELNSLFSDCSSLSDITPLENWNVSNCQFFSLFLLSSVILF